MAADIEGGLSIVISGSFRKHYEAICKAIGEFEGIGIDVLSPRHSRVVNPGDAFALLEADETACVETLEREHLDSICQADALYLSNPEGYVGLSSAMELGWALALGKAVFAQEAPADASLRPFVGEPAAPGEVKRRLVSGNAQGKGTRLDNSSLRGLQSLVRQVAAERGFDDETHGDKILLMLEEFGELAKALRKHVGLKIDEARQGEYRAVSEEMADMLFYLLDLANACGVDLLTAFREKEQRNAARRWTSQARK
jgi:NTP pyrophosphatase (non-canonical NTP hydrolase)